MKVSVMHKCILAILLAAPLLAACPTTINVNLPGGGTSTPLDTASLPPGPSPAQGSDPQPAPTGSTNGIVGPKLVMASLAPIVSASSVPVATPSLAPLFFPPVKYDPIVAKAPGRYVPGRKWVYKVTETVGEVITVPGNWTVDVITNTGTRSTLRLGNYRTQFGLEMSDSGSELTVDVNRFNPWVGPGWGSPKSSSSERVSVPAGSFDAIHERYGVSSPVAVESLDHWVNNDLGLIRSRWSSTFKAPPGVPVPDIKTYRVTA
jgi:hypothetical protein